MVNLLKLVALRLRSCHILFSCVPNLAMGSQLFSEIALRRFADITLPWNSK